MLAERPSLAVGAVASASRMSVLADELDAARISGDPVRLAEAARRAAHALRATALLHEVVAEAFTERTGPALPRS